MLVSIVSPRFATSFWPNIGSSWSAVMGLLTTFNIGRGDLELPQASLHHIFLKKHVFFPCSAKKSLEDGRRRCSPFFLSDLLCFWCTWFFEVYDNDIGDGFPPWRFQIYILYLRDILVTPRSNFGSSKSHCRYPELSCAMLTRCMTLAVQPGKLDFEAFRGGFFLLLFEKYLKSNTKMLIQYTTACIICMHTFLVYV